MNFFNRMNLPSNPCQLAVFRILLGFYIIYAVTGSVFDLLLVIDRPLGVHVLMPKAVQNFIADYCILGLRISTVLFAFLLSLGLFTKYVTKILTVSFLLLFSFFYKHTDVPIHWLYCWFPLVVLSFSKPSDVLSLDSLIHKRSVENSTKYTWPRELILAWFVYIYFFAGISKILPLRKFLIWVNGETSRAIIYNRYLESPFHFIFGKPFFDYSEPSIIFLALSVFAVLLELSTVVMLFTRKYTVIVVTSLVLMHLFLYMCGVAGFMQTAFLLGICFLPNKWFDFKKSK
ncbi:hypothetical protein [Flavicella sediminum]|uniref:hypothetical protein n=1 Tax=Flavicella sediminum TaxID=2585141 RepID=UPI00111E694F|nr:hypothetical protein [Flavicella sediminum]